MVKKIGNYFVLDSGKTTYVFCVNKVGQLIHLYYGKKITIISPEDAKALLEKHEFAPGNTINYDNEHKEFSPEDECYEMSAYGKGDIREPFLEIIYKNGSFSSDFVYSGYETDGSQPEPGGLPRSYGSSSHLVISLKEKNYGLMLKLHYYIYDDCGIITRTAVLENESGNEVTIKRFMSMQLDMPKGEYVFTSFNGSWAREMNKNETPVLAGTHVNSSYTGTSSNRENPYVMLSSVGTCEDHGDCYGFNLVYSGNHYEAIQVNSYGKVRFVSGINPRSFCFTLKPGAVFEAPEAVMGFSHEGYNGLSLSMHKFVRKHIVRGIWKDKPRPVLLNSREACSFDINNMKLLKLAKAAKDVGIELFVVDDGWFGKREDGTRSLGDWEPDIKKLPGGLSSLCNKIKSMGLDFGIWVEPEMVSVDSMLYENHPDWAVCVPGTAHSEGRNQRILDLSREEVQDYVIEIMSSLFSSAEISYVKWDMNRIFSDYYSSELSEECQGEMAHRYILGLYKCIKELTEKFPKILFEGCASGGNRFDLGMLCYFPQIWGSDNTDAVCRADIQRGYSYGYPLSSVSAHVSSCPNHQTLRNVPLETRFNVAAFGVMGYECNLCDMKGEEKESIKNQVELYKKWRDVFFGGDFYRGRCDENITEWTCVSKDKKRAVGFIMQKFVKPNTQFEYYCAKGLNPKLKYHFYNRPVKRNIKQFKDLVNTASPMHINLAHGIGSKLVKIDGEVEDYILYGDTLMNSGVRLKQAYGGTGYNSEVRLFQDFFSCLYFMEEEK